MALIRDDHGIVRDDDGGKIMGTRIKREKVPDYKEIYVTWADGARYGPYGMKISFFDQIVDEDENSQPYETWLKKVTLIMPFASAKELATWLQVQIDAFEKESGGPIYIGRPKQSSELSQSLPSDDSELQR